MSLSEHRIAIDQLDERIVKLLNKRTKHVLAIGDIKLKAGEEIYAPHREKAVFERICALNPGPITSEQLRAIYREIMSSALALEKNMTIAYLGPQATFSHQAAVQKFGKSLNYSAQKTIPAVFNEVAKRNADYGVVPVENTTGGGVTNTLDMFVETDLKIISKIDLHIRHCLASNYKKNEIKTLFIHPQTLAQCRQWIQENLPSVEIFEVSSNARSAQMAATGNLEITQIQSEKGTRSGKTINRGKARVLKADFSAAITGEMAANTYKLKIIEKDVQDNSMNVTRFLVLGQRCSPPTGHDRTSLMISLADKAGALHEALAVFYKFNINLTKIESRPSKRKAWEYFFFIDCDGHFQEPKVAKAIEELGQHCHFVKILGSYPNTE